MRRILLACLALVACGGADDGENPPAATGRPATPPPGWHTVRNDLAGFTVAVPRDWRATARARATLLRSSDRRVAVTVVADTSPAGMETAPGAYARRTLEQLPGFEGTVEPDARPVRGSPLRGARLEAEGRLATSRGPQRITVAALHRPGRATYALLAFRSARAPGSSDRVVNGMLRTLRPAESR